MALSQLRLNQITGSAPNNFKPAAINQGVIAQAVAFPDLSGSLGYFAQALTNIHGNVEFGAQVPGKIAFAGANNIEILGERGGGAQSVKMEQHDGTNAQGLTFLLDSTGTASAAKVKVTNVGGTGAGSAGANAAIQIGAVAGGYAIQSGLTSGVAGVVEVSDGATLRLGEASGDTSIDITPTNVGATEKIKVQNTTGTSTEAIKLNALAGGIDVDAQLAVSVESTAGSITIGSAVADGQAVNLGKPGAAEIILAPHGTASNEKISIINTSGNADDAIKIDSVAGGLLLAAGDDSLHLDADGTDADALNIDSAGGMDVDVVGLFAVDAGTMSMDATGASNLTVTAGADAADLTISMGNDGTPRDSSIIISSAGTGTDAIQLAASAGAVDVDGSSVTIDALDAGAINIGTSTAGTNDTSPVNIGTSATARTITVGNAASTKVDVNALEIELDSAGKVIVDSASNAVDSMTLNSAGGIRIDGAAQPVEIECASSIIKIGADNVNQGIDYGTAGQRMMDFGSTAATRIKHTSKLQILSASNAAAGFLAMSASAGVVFAADGAMRSAYADADGMKFANNTEFATFRASSLFNANTTVIGALNALAGSVSSSEPSLFEAKITSAIVPGNPITVALVAGDTTTLANHARNKVAVYYNGQKMLSGSVADFNADNCDYRIVGDGSARQLHLNFHTVSGDLVQVMDFQ